MTMGCHGSVCHLLVVGLALVLVCAMPQPGLAAPRGVVAVGAVELGTSDDGPLHLYTRSHAVVIGIDQYQSLPRLGGAVRDARKVADYLKNHGFEVSLLLDGQATRAAITRLVGDVLPGKVGDNDRVLVYFAGHGLSRGDGEAAMGYLMPVEGQRDAPASTAISMAELQRWFSQYPAKHVLYIADACYSGLSIGTRSAGLSPEAKHYLRDITKHPARVMLTAGSSGQEAHEYLGHGLFTYFLLQGMGGAADVNGDGLVTTDELAAYVKPNVAKVARSHYGAQQHPQLARMGEGEFLFVTPNTKKQIGAGPAQLPAEAAVAGARVSRSAVLRCLDATQPITDFPWFAKVTVHFTVGTANAVTDAKVIGTTGRLAGCIAYAFKQIRGLPHLPSPRHFTQIYVFGKGTLAKPTSDSKPKTGAKEASDLARAPIKAAPTAAKNAAPTAAENATPAAVENEGLESRIYKPIVLMVLGRPRVDEIVSTAVELSPPALQAPYLSAVELAAYVKAQPLDDPGLPAVLFRLAEMYYSDALAAEAMGNRADFAAAIAIYQRLHWQPAGAQMAPLPEALRGAWQDKCWPSSKFADIAMYLQGYAELMQGQRAKAIQTFRTLAARYPDSVTIAEAWLRVGEMHFDDSEFEAAADAYDRAASRALATNDTKNYALALYKLGWSNFQLYKYPEAVRWFQKLIEFEDAQTAKAGPGDKKDQFDLRKEAIEYLAKSLAEPSWDDDGCDDFGNEDSKTTCLTMDPRLRPRLYAASVLKPKFDDFPNWRAGIVGEPLNRLQAAFNGREAVRKELINGKPYVYDILVTYGNTLYEQALDDYYRQAVLVLGYTIDNYPVAREAQEMQRKVIRSVDILAAAGLGYAKQLEKDKNDVTAKLGLAMALDDQGKQMAERRKYLAMFCKGTNWYKKWGGDKDLAAQVDETVGRVRMDFAQLIHMQAQTLRASGDEEAALAKYAEAAREYEVLLRADMEAPGAYELAWTLSETLFFAGKRCDALRDKDNNLLRLPIEVKKDDGKFETRNEGELVTYPAEATVGLKKACEQMKKSVEYYTLVRDWKGQRTRGPDGVPLDFAEQAGFSAILASSLVLNARAAYPLKDPEHLETRMLPELRPSAAQDEADVDANEKSDVVVLVQRKPIDAVAVDWLLAVDGYIAANQFNPKDPERPQRLALQAAELLFKNRHFDRWPEGVTPRTTAEFWSARGRFWRLIKKYPSSAQAAESFKNMLTSYNIERDFKKLQEVALYGDEKNIGPPEERKKIKAAVEGFELGALGKGAQAIFDKADTISKTAVTNPNPDQAGKQIAEARKTYEESGDLFRSLRAKSPETKVQMAALMNAMRAFYRAEKWEKCFEVLKEAEQMVRAAKPTEAKEKEENLKRLNLIITTRAQLNFGG